MSVRRPIAVLLSRFPSVTETFILREVIEMERQGQPVVLVPLLRAEGRAVHPEAEPWVRRAVFTPFLSRAILASSLRFLARRPLRTLGALLGATLPAWRSPWVLLQTLAIFPKSVRIADLLQGRGVGHVHAHYATHPATAAWIVHRLTGIGWSFTVHAHDVFVPWRRPMLARKIRDAAFVRAISRFNRAFLERLHPGESSGKIEVIHVGIEPERYDDPRSPESPPLLLTVASLQEYKGIPVLVEACRILAGEGIDFHSAVIGEGLLRGEIADRIRAAGLADRVHLLGVLPQGEVAGSIRHASVFVLPSVVARDGQMEGIPVALMEAMATGVPVVASRLSGIPELVEDGASGVLVAPGDAGALAGGIRGLLLDPGRAERLGGAGRDAVRRDFVLRDCTASLLRAIDAENEPMPPRVREAIARCAAPDLDGRTVGVRAVHDRRDSLVAEILLAGSPVPRELVLKSQKDRPGQSAQPSVRAWREHRVLRHLEQAMGEAGSFGVPHPLHLCEGGAAILMTRCPGESLDRRVRRARSGADPVLLGRVVAEMGLAGEWLRRFQEVTREAGDLLEEAGGSAIHGDYWPGNLFVDPERGRIEAIDFEGFRAGGPWEDAAWFLNHLALYFAWPGARMRFGRMRDAFLRGYTAGRPFDRAALAEARAATARGMLVARGGMGTGPREWLQNRVLRAIARGKGE